MKSFVCLLAVVCCAVQLVSAAEDSAKRFRIFKVNESGPFKKHNEIVAELNAKELSPEQTVYLLSSYGPNGYRTLFGDWRAYDLTPLNRVFPGTCRKSNLEHIKEECNLLDQEEDKTSVAYANVVRYCHSVVEKVADYCKDKIEPEFEN